MMMSEFFDRTGYEPSYEEYRFIEDSYYDFIGDKDAFCKWWLKAQKSGEWAKELKLRKQIVDITVELSRELEAKEENLDFYRPYFDRALVAEGILKVMDRTSKFALKMKDEKDWRHFDKVQVKYIRNDVIEFINVIEESGWITSFKVNEIECICDIKV